MSQAAPLHAQTITNVAQIEWTVGGARIERPSNPVMIEVERTPVPLPVTTLTTYRFNRSASTDSFSVPVTTCRRTAGDSPVRLDGVFADLTTAPALLVETKSIRAGEPIVVAVQSANDNRDPLAVDTITVRLTSPGGDAEMLILQESAPDSGRFVGIVRTTAIPPTPIEGDCQLSVSPGDRLILSGVSGENGSSITASTIEILIDPFGIVFDSNDGAPVQGARVTLVDANTRLPTAVFGDDGISTFPNSVITGSTVTDSGGNVYVFPTGDYRFPFARAGSYILVVEPPAPYTTPSAATPASLISAGLMRPDGGQFTIVPGSFGLPFVLDSPAPVRIDIPVDRPGGALVLRKVASTTFAVPGDAVHYKVTVQNGDAARPSGLITLTDILPPEMRLQKDSVRYNGNKIPYLVSDTGRNITVELPRLSANQSGTVSYLLEVRPDAKPGPSLNRASAIDTLGARSNIADATVRIARDELGDRVTIIGRITDGGCTIDPNAANGVQGVRVMLEDGSYAVTDIEGRYHFEGVQPGLHVVQMDGSTLPSGQVPADCTRNARSAGSAISRFVDAKGGRLVRVDFASTAGRNVARLEGETVARVAPPSDSDAAGSDRDWISGQTAAIEWLFPEPTHNPRTKAVRVAIKHFAGQTVKLYVGGVPVDAMTIENIKRDAGATFAVSLWRSVELTSIDTRLTAEIIDANGAIVTTLNRTVHFANSALRAEFVPEKSLLVADGVSRPVIALRMFERDGRPARHGLTGEFSVPAPYYPAVEADAQAAKLLAGLERGRTSWQIEGDEGIAYIELEPTTASGGLSVTLPFRDADATRNQRIDLWLTPGKRPWTVVGFAAGTVGFNTLATQRQSLDRGDDRWLTDGRIALYAKGRIKGKWLLTLAYDSDKQADETRFGGVIDPTAYYTIYADRSERRYDAASTRRLYVKLERPQFYALFGDYETGLNDTQLLRYSRVFNGIKSEYRSSQVSATIFAADTPFRHRREEIQGNGLSGPYALALRNILANSEKVVIETRDRFRSNLITATRTLVRHIDYDIDYARGTLTFREPVLSRSSGLDPQFIIADYEVDGVAERVTNGGGHATWTNTAKTLTVGASAIHDEDDQSRTNTGGIDLRYTHSATTEVRAEFGVSDAQLRSGVAGTDSGTSIAWLVEADHHSKTVDILAYARQQDRGFGVGQTNNGENGSRKFGIDGRLRITPAISIAGSAWHEQYLGSDLQRQAGRLFGEYRTKDFDIRAGVTLANDRLEGGRTASSTIGQLGATKRFFGGKFEIDAQSEIAIAQSESIDFPARHKLGARLSLTSDVTLVGSYEIAQSDVIDARTARLGFDVKPWTGGRITASANQQVTDEYGPRSYAAFGFAQSVPVNTHLTIDFSVDSNKTLGRIDPSRILTVAQPVASGGFLGTGGLIAEDFTAVTVGATYRSQNWAIAGRAEARASETGDRYGITLSALRQIGEGRAFGGAVSWYKASLDQGPSTDTKNAAISWASRPDDSRVAFLNKLEFREDSVRGAVNGAPGPIGGAPLLVSGDVTSKRIINSLSVNWSPIQKRDDGSYLGRSEVQLFWGTRYVSDKFGDADLKGWSNIVGADLRFDLSETFDVGVGGTVRQGNGGRSLTYSGGPSLGIAPFKNAYVSVGYNIVGFEDRDFDESRYLRRGPFVTMRLKFDQTNLAGLGLGNRTK